MLTPSSAHAVRKEGRKVHVHWDFTWFAVTTYFVANYVEFCKKKTRNFTGSSRFITALHKRGKLKPLPAEWGLFSKLGGASQFVEIKGEKMVDIR